jgi:hypothetical protein
MPDRINFITESIPKEKYDEVFTELEKFCDHIHVFEYTVHYYQNPKTEYTICGQTFDDTYPYEVDFILDMSQIAYAWVEHGLGSGNGAFVCNTLVDGKPKSK